MPPRVPWQGLIHCFILSIDWCLTRAGHSRLGMSIFFRHAKIDLYPVIHKLLPIIPFDVGEQLRALEPGRSVCVCVCVCVCAHAHVQLYLFVIPWTISTPGSSVQGIFQRRILEWVAISFSRESSRPRDQTHIS